MKNKQIKIAEQEDILNETDKNLIISASAGSGKTTVMIRKILKYILEEKCKVDELLVLTYTKAAAEEMKKKLLEKLKEQAFKNEKLLEQLDLVQNSDVSTFDSFCQKLIKKYFYLLNIDPSFGILEGGEQAFFQGEALNLAIDEMKETNPAEFEFLLDNFSASRDESSIKEIIVEIYNFMTSILNDDEFINISKNLYSEDEKIAEKFLLSHYSEILKNLQSQLIIIKQKIDNLGLEKYKKFTGNFILVLEQLIIKTNFQEFVDYITSSSLGKLFDDPNDEIGIKDEITEVRKIFNKQKEQIKNNFISGEDIKNSYKNCKSLINFLFILLNLFKNHYTTLKLKRNKLDFNDIERLAIKILKNEQLNNEIKNSYKYVFIDEFQDANKVQEELIFLLNNNNLFFVGDTKQSIYAFRQSDPEIFSNIEKNFKEDVNSSAKMLNCNFRTNKNILEFVNAVFNVLMTENTCALNYKDKAQFDPKAEYLSLDNEICVELNIINTPKEEAQKLIPTKVYSVKENTCQETTTDKNYKESIFVCNKILELLGQDIYDKELDTTRKVQYKDITILLIKRGNFLKTLLDQFNKIGIPYTINLNNNLEECYDNQVFYNLLKLCLNFQDDYALYSVLSSALFNFSDEEIALIKNTYSNTTYFYESLNQCLNNKTILQNKVSDFYKTLETFSFNVKYLGIYYALEKIIREKNYFLNISTEEDFQERCLNIESFVNSFIDSKYNKDIYNYIIYRETAVRKEKNQTNKSFTNCIEITTMHSSKGLEYPVVILPFLSVDFTKEPTHSEIKINKELGVGLKNYNLEDRTLSGGIFYNACKLKNKKIEMSEKIRLLYVAMTRAKNKLILCGATDKKFKKINSDYETLTTNNFLSLIVGTLPNEKINEINNLEEYNDILYNNQKLILSKQQVTISMSEEKSLIIEKDNNFEIADKLKEFLLQDLSYQKNDIALKNSVSQFAFDDNASLNPAPKNFLIQEHLSEKASDIGTLYHKLLEIINFNDIHQISDIDDFISCNFNEDEINIFKKLNFEKIYKNICLVKNDISLGDKILKEQKFVMNIPHNQIVGGEIEDKILIQGIIDLIIIKENKIILIDYKLSKKTNSAIKETYEKQIELYKLALYKKFKNKNIECKIINLYNNSIINM